MPDLRPTAGGSHRILLRSEPALEDLATVERIVRSTGAFREDEIAIAVELLQDALDRGAQASGYHFLFAVTDGATVGYACYGPIGCSLHGWDLYWIAVDQNWRGGGVGRQLLEDVERRVPEAGGRRLYAETSSRADYAATRGFYEARGYRAEAELTDFYAPGDSKVIYVKALV